MVLPPNREDDYQVLRVRLQTLLPETYRDTYEGVQPVSMGSAGLKFGSDGRVLWDEIWASFCHLAMAGGPPHRGTLLEPATMAAIQGNEERTMDVAHEICRGVEMVSGLAAEPSDMPGWVRVDCPSRAMAGWLARAINMENVSAHVDGMTLHLPAGPEFRLEKEIKNVVVAVAKTCHYWLGHTSTAQHRAIGALFDVMDVEWLLIQPPLSVRECDMAEVDRVRTVVTSRVRTHNGLETTAPDYRGWLGMDCLGVEAAVWMMRMMAASNVLCRREGTSIYVAINPATDHDGERVTAMLIRAHRMAQAQGVMEPDSRPGAPASSS